MPDYWFFQLANLKTKQIVNLCGEYCYFYATEATICQ